ncbi:hypothetical protein ACQP06_07415 [Nocardia sp. CA-136227]|uniref:hypothetical protein n=1 Tax=Nocardia sp. CA-136227 TaxID=3239979 RepID=UPI003D968F7D
MKPLENGAAGQPTATDPPPGAGSQRPHANRGATNMPARWIKFDRYTDPYEQWKAIDDFTSSKPVVVIEYRGDERDSLLCGRHGRAHWDRYSDIAFGTVYYTDVRHAAAREQVIASGTIVERSLMPMSVNLGTDTAFESRSRNPASVEDQSL